MATTDQIESAANLARGDGPGIDAPIGNLIHIPAGDPDADAAERRRAARALARLAPDLAAALGLDRPPRGTAEPIDRLLDAAAHGDAHAARELLGRLDPGRIRALRVELRRRIKDRPTAREVR